MYLGHAKYALFVRDFNETAIFYTDFRKNTQIRIFMKIYRIGAELLHADRRTDRHDEINSSFPQFLRKLLKTKTNLTFDVHSAENA